MTTKYFTVNFIVMNHLQHIVRHVKDIMTCDFGGEMYSRVFFDQISDDLGQSESVGD